jgi:predicted CXXCH cytochrome family protein
MPVAGLRATLAALVTVVSMSAFAAPPAAKPNARADAKQKAPPAAGPSQGPLPRGEKAAWTHAPYAAGDCSICHERADEKSPGKVTKVGAELCLQCHDEFQPILARKHPHPPARTDCTACHNAHDARQPKLLHA